MPFRNSLLPRGLRGGWTSFALIIVMWAVWPARIVTAGTDVSGVIATDTVWTKAESPYFMTETVTVGSGATLTIEHGVTVHAAPDTALVIGDVSEGPGTLVARGEPGTPIEFLGLPTGDRGGPSSSWIGLRFEPLAEPAVFDRPGGGWIGGSIVEFATVAFAGDIEPFDPLGQGGIGVDGAATPFLRGVTIRDCLGAALSADLARDASMRLEDCLFENSLAGCCITGDGRDHRFVRLQCIGNGGRGMQVRGPGSIYADCVSEGNEQEGAIHVGGDILVSGCTFSNNGRFGFRQKEAGGSQFIACDFTGNGGGPGFGGGLRVGLATHGGLTSVVDCSLTSNHGPGFEAMNADDVQVEGCVVAQNECGIAVSGGLIELIGNTIEDNIVDGGVTIGNTTGGILVDNVIRRNGYEESGFGGGLRIDGTAQLIGNHIAENFAGTGGGIAVIGDSTVLRGNVICDNVAATGGGVAILGESCDLATVPGFAPNEIVGNVAAIGPAVANLALFEPNGDSTADASDVVWGTTVPEEVSALVHDFFDDATLGVVLIAPYQTGLITEDVRWTAADSPIHVTESIIVGGGATLSIEPGVEVIVSPGIGIELGVAAFGPATLVARGTEEAPITFRSSQTEPAAGDWVGIRLAEEATDAVFDEPDGAFLSGSIIENAVIRHAGASGSVEGAITIVESAPYLRSCLIEDCSRSGVKAEFGASETRLRIEDMTIRRTGGALMGAGISVENGIGHRITGCYFEDCIAVRGGAIGVLGSLPTILGCTFVECSASDRGGAIDIFSAVDAVPVVIADCVFEENTCGGSGGAVWIGGQVGADGGIRDSWFIGNSAQSAGALVVDADGTDVVFEGNVFTANRASQHAAFRILIDGRAFLLANEVVGNTTELAAGGLVSAAVFRTEQFGGAVDDNIITDNEVLKVAFDGTVGAGLTITGSPVFVRRNTIARNRIPGGSSAGLRIETTSCQLVDNVIEDNHAGVDGGGLTISSSTNSVRLIGNRIVGNTAGQDGGGLYWAGRLGDLSLAGEAFNVVAGNLAAGRGDAIFYTASRGDDLEASGVCWGTTEAEVIAAMVHDGEDDPALGFVLRDPIVDDPSCSGLCQGDLDGSGVVGFTDLVTIIAAFGPCADGTLCEPDIDRDGAVTVADLYTVLANWGPCPTS